jgi:hypothetical protein
MFAANCCVCDDATVALAGETDRVKTLTEAVAVYDGAAAMAAVIVCFPVDDGAVYKPVVLIVPTLELPPVTLSTDHATLWLVSFLTVAVNWAVEASVKVTEVWFKEIAGVVELLEPELLDCEPHPARATETANTEKRRQHEVALLIAVLPLGST